MYTVCAKILSLLVGVAVLNLYYNLVNYHTRVLDI